MSHAIIYWNDKGSAADIRRVVGPFDTEHQAKLSQAPQSSLVELESPEPDYLKESESGRDTVFYRVVVSQRVRVGGYNSNVWTNLEFDMYCGPDESKANIAFEVTAGHSRRFYRGTVAWEMQHEHIMPTEI